MNTRDVVSLIGACLLAVGGFLSQQHDNQKALWIGQILVVISPILMSTRALTASSNERKIVEKVKEEIQ